MKLVSVLLVVPFLAFANEAKPKEAEPTKQKEWCIEVPVPNPNPAKKEPVRKDKICGPLPTPNQTPQPKPTKE